MRAGEVLFEILNRPPLNTFLLFGSDQERPLTLLSPCSSKNHSHTWPKLSSNFGEAQSKLFFGVVFGTAAMLLSDCYAAAFDVSSFAVIDRCGKEPCLAGTQKGKGEGRAVGVGGGRRGWVGGGKGEKRRRIGLWELLGACSGQVQRKVRDGEGKRALPEA